MNILILCNHSLKSYPYHEMLAEYPFNIYLLTDKVFYEKNRDYILNNENFYASIDSYENFSSNGLVELDVVDLHSRVGLDAIVTVSETEIERAAKLREYLNIPGQSFISANAYRDKIKMKQYALEGGIRVPKFKSIDNAIDLIEFVDKNDFPVFVKPRSSAGAIGAQKIEDSNELKSFLLNGYNLSNSSDSYGSYDKSYEVESYIDDDFYCINGVFCSKELLLCHVSKYNTHVDMEHIKKKGYWSAETIAKENKIYNKAVEFINDLIKTLPSPDSFVFHCEVFVNDLLEITLCEIACRPPGGGIMNTIDKVYNTNFFKTCVLLQIDPNLIDKKELLNKKNYDILYATVLVHPSRGTLTYMKDECKLNFVEEYYRLATVGEEYEGSGSDSIDGAAAFILQGHDEKELGKNVEQSIKWFKDNTTWE